MIESQGAQTEQELFDALAELREEPYGTARSARAEELVEAAERLELGKALPVAMLELLGAYEYGNEVRKAPVLFSRILKLYQDAPDTFDDWSVHRLFWCFKWITWALLCLPEIPLATVEGWIEKMKEHYVAAGKPLAAVHTSRFHLASFTGIGADSAYEHWATRPRDEFSDCAACEARNRGVHWLDRGDHARALKEWGPVLEGEIGCAEEPASTISYALLSLVHEGRPDEAVSLHRSGYRAAKSEVGMDAQIGRHLEFLALTGNGARGLELLAENRRRFDSTTTPLDRLFFLDGVRILLERVSAEGAGDAPVVGPNDRSYSVASLLAEVVEQSDEIARRFDERNGTAHLGDWHRARVTQEPLTAEPLPLGVRVAPIANAPSAPVVVPATAVPEDFATLLAEARALRKIGKPGDELLWDAVAERAAEQDLDALLRAELADHQAFKHTAKREWDETAALTRQAAELFDEAGEPGRAAARRARVEWCAFMKADQPSEVPWDGFDALLATADALLAEERIAPTEYAIVRHCRAASAFHLTMTAADEESAAAARERFAAENQAFHETATRFDIPSRAAISESLRCNVLEGGGELEAALAAIESAVAYAEKAERPWSLAPYLAQHGHVLNRMNRLDEAAPLLHRALTLAAEWPDADLDVTRVLMELAQNRLNADDMAAAIPHLTTAAARFDRLDAPVEAANARSMLGQALLRSGRRADGIAVLESLLTEDGEARLHERARAQIRLDLSRALMAEQEPRAAAEVLARLADFVAGWEEQGVLTLVAGELACALYAAQMWEPGEKAIERALAAHAAAPNPAVACKMLRVAAEAESKNRGAAGAERALDLLSRADAVNEAAEEIEGRYRRWPETALNADLRVLALATAGRFEEALAASDLAIATWRGGGDKVIGEYAEAVLSAALIEGRELGRAKDAVARLSEAITRCRAAGHDRAVTVLTRHAESLQG
ncbi:MAG TPA: hypothetical protein VFN97_10255 [Actinospica sp.]|nr:hypothetical protein [Actinospica sp.]